MKSIILSACIWVCVYGLSDQFKNHMSDSLIKTAAICVPEAGANEDDIAELIDHKPPSRREGKCVIHCFQKHFGMLKDDRYDKDTTISNMEELKADDFEIYGKFVKAMEMCDPELTSDPEKDLCEFAFKSASCVHREALKLGIDHDELMN